MDISEIDLISKPAMPLVRASADQEWTFGIEGMTCASCAGRVERSLAAMPHMENLDRRMAEIAEMRQALHRLADSRHGDQRPDCPILEDLEKA